MYLTYQKSLPSFDQHMVQLEMNEPDESKVYVEFQEGFVPLAAKYYEAFSSDADVPGVHAIPVLSPAPVVEVLMDKPTIAEGVKEVIVEKPTVVILDEVPVVDVVRPDPVSGPAPVVAPAQQVTKKARKTSV
jgi:hypothetical protein